MVQVAQVVVQAAMVPYLEVAVAALGTIARAAMVETETSEYTMYKGAKQ